MRFAPSLLGFALIASVAVTGCSKREDLKVAEFRDRSITVAEFEDAYAHVDPTYLPKASGMEGRKEFLTTMLNKEVMAYKADELGYDKDPAVQQGMEGFERMTLQLGYLKRAVADKVTVTDAELKKYYENTGVTLNVKQILMDTSEQAEEAYAALKEGMDFDSACRQFSKAEDAEDGGLVVTASFGTLIPDLQDPLFALPVGGFTEPIYTPQGWVIVKVLKRNDPPQKKPYEEAKEQVEKEVQRNKEAVALNKFTEKLRDDYGVVWNYDTIAIVFNALPPDRAFETAPRRSDEVYPLLLFDPADYDKPIVSYQGKSITVKDFSDFYDQASFFTRPRQSYRYGGIRSFLTERIMNEIAVDIVRKSDIAQDPEVKRVIDAKREELMVGLLYDDMVNKQTVVTAQDIQNYYNDNIVKFQTPEKRKFGVVLAGDIETAQQAYVELKAGKPVRTVALAYSIDEDTKETLGETGELSHGEQPEIDAVGFSMQRVGDVSEPFQTSRGWMVLKLVSRTDARTFTLEEAKGRVEAALRQIKNDQRLQELLAKWKEEYAVVIHEDNLAKVKITERSAAEVPAKKSRQG
ncbi:MAG TPA: peptidyl-prolyl cis-trans isomerase [Candidatus Krumholzibacteria bacterium]|nr:peptidyl-prolyl cis-trans isomerase [Candidatus Krumholzibacteria bacterium]